MKKVKALGAVLVCICLIASMFAGCSKISFEGKWISTLDLSDTLNAELDMSKDTDGKYFGEFKESISLDMIYTFDSDNAYVVSVDEEKFKTDFNAYMEKYIDYMVEGTYKYAEDQGMNREQFDELYKQQEGTTVREGMLKEVDADAMVKEIVSGFVTNEKQPLLIEDGKFYETDDQGNKKSYETFTLEGDTLTINGQFDLEDKPMEDEYGIYPLVLTKQA